MFELILKGTSNTLTEQKKEELSKKQMNLLLMIYLH